MLFLCSYKSGFLATLSTAACTILQDTFLAAPALRARAHAHAHAHTYINIVVSHGDTVLGRAYFEPNTQTCLLLDAALKTKSYPI